MAKIQEGHLDLLGVLFTRHSHKAFALCYRMVGDGDKSNDLVQEAFLRVLRYRDSFRGDASFATWLYRIVTNVCLDHLGSERRTDVLRERLATEAGMGESFLTIDESEVSVVSAAFQRLSADKQQLLTQSRIEGFGYKEIASNLGISEGAARVRVHRIVSELRSIMDDLKETSS